jgi:PKD repeat protein
VIVPTRETVYSLGNGNEPLTAAFEYTPSPPVTSTAITFDGEPSTDSDGEVVEYRWQFGSDESTTTGVTVEYTFEEPGTYPVTLEVIDDEGAIDTRTRRIEVTAPTTPTSTETATPTTTPTPASTTQPPSTTAASSPRSSDT